MYSNNSNKIRKENKTRALIVKINTEAIRSSCSPHNGAKETENESI